MATTIALIVSLECPGERGGYFPIFAFPPSSCSSRFISISIGVLHEHNDDLVAVAQEPHQRFTDDRSFPALSTPRTLQNLSTVHTAH